MRLGVTPVPIPNTMVKTQAADGTWLETARESRWLPENIFNRIGTTKAALSRLSTNAVRPTSDASGDVAQLGEHLPCKQGVKSSNLSISIGTTFRDKRTVRERTAGTLTNSYRSNGSRRSVSNSFTVNAPWTTTSKERTGPATLGRDGPRKRR